MDKKFLNITLAGLLSFPLSALAIQPAVGEIKDSRTTGQFFNELTIEINLMGDDVTDVEAVRVTLDKAVDDTGRDLIKTDTFASEKEFKSLSDFGQKQNKITLQFKNPARKASTVAEISGTIEGFSPNKDPNSKVSIAKFLSYSGKPLEHPALKAAGVSLTVMTDADLKKKQEEEAKNLGGLNGGINQMFGGIFPNSLTIELSDPGKKLVGYVFRTSTGEEIRPTSRSWSQNTYNLSFGAPIPTDALLEVQLLTDKALVKTPLKLTNVLLP